MSMTKMNKEEVQQKVEDLVKRLEDFDKFFKTRPDIYDHYLNLLFKGGKFVIEKLIAEETKKRKHKIKSRDLSMDITTLASKYLPDLKNEVKVEINTILTLRFSHAEAALISLDDEAFYDDFLNPLKYSIEVLSNNLNKDNKSRFDKIVEECKTSTKNSDSYQTYLDEIRNKGVEIKSIQELYEETKQNIEDLLKEVIDHKISHQKDEITLTLCVPNMTLNSTLENVLAKGFHDRIKRQYLDTITQVVCKFLTETKNKYGVKDVKFNLDCKTDWKTCVQTSNIKMAEKLLSKPGDLPDKETLNELCAVFGRKSDITFKVCKKVCCSITESSPHIIDVYASRKAVVLKQKGEKEEEFEIKFVVITENLNEESRKELEVRIQQDYNTLPIRDRNQLSGEETELRKEGRHDLKGEDLNRVKTCMRLNAHTLLERHTYLTIISGSQIKSTGYESGNHEINKEQPCIVLNVPFKGYIPIDEEPFQKEYDGVVTDVREDLFVLYADTANARHNFLKNGCQISGNFSKGTLGGFVVHPDYGPCGISCCHVLLSPAELTRLSENDEINWERPSLLARTNDKTCEGNVFQPEESDTDNNLIGKLVKVCYRRGRPDSLDMDAYGMDVALFQLNQRLPVSSKFPVVQVASDDISSDESDNNSPAYREIPQQFGKGAVAGFAWLEGKGFSKFGATTGYTTGEMSINCGTSVKVPFEWIYKHTQNHFKFILHNQVSIIKRKIDTDDVFSIDRPDGSTEWFGYHGDSGALVYQKTTDGNLVCVGMVTGGTFATKHCIVTPILPVLKEMGITSFKDFDSEQLEVNVRRLVQEMGLVNQRIGNVQQSMGNVQQSVGNVQQRMGSIEANMENGFRSIMEHLTQRPNP